MWELSMWHLTSKEEMSEMMVGRKVNLQIDKGTYNPGKCVLSVEDLSVKNHFSGKLSVNHVSFDVKEGEIVYVSPELTGMDRASWFMH